MNGLASGELFQPKIGARKGVSGARYQVSGSGFSALHARSLRTGVRPRSVVHESILRFVNSKVSVRTDSERTTSQPGPRTHPDTGSQTSGTEPPSLVRRHPTPDARHPFRWVTAALLLLVHLSSCTPSPLETGDLLITLTRDGNCFNCPWYSVSIFADGHIQFKGIAGTIAHGERYAFIDHDTLQSLANTILRMRLFSRQNNYDTRKFYDGPTTTIDVRFAGMHKRITDHYGAPDSVRYVERLIDIYSGANFWIGGGAEPPNPNSREARLRRHEIDSLEAIDDEMLQQYQSLRDNGDTRQAFHLFHEERKLSDSINKAYEFFTGLPVDTTSQRKRHR